MDLQGGHPKEITRGACSFLSNLDVGGFSFFFFSLVLVLVLVCLLFLKENRKRERVEKGSGRESRVLSLSLDIDDTRKLLYAVQKCITLLDRSLIQSILVVWAGGLNDSSHFVDLAV